MKLRRAQKGDAMILTICVMALVVVLCLALLLTASVVLNSAQKELDQEKSRLLAVTLSQEFDTQLTDRRYSFASQAEEDHAKETDGGTLWFTLKQQMQDNSWPYFNEDERGHTAKYAYKTFQFNTAVLPDSDELRTYAKDAEVRMYWESEAGAITLDEVPLTVQVTCTVNRQACTITSKYMLRLTEQTVEVTAENGQTNTEKYEQWAWSLNWRE